MRSHRGSHVGRSLQQEAARGVERMKFDSDPNFMRHALLVAAFLLPPTLAAQTSGNRASPDGVVLSFARFADIFGSRLADAFDSIPANRYDYRPTPTQQTIGYIAQHLEDANYSL